MTVRSGSSTNSLDNGEMYVWDQPGHHPWTIEDLEELTKRQKDFTERRRLYKSLERPTHVVE